MNFLAFLLLFLKVGISYEKISSSHDLSEEEKEKEDFWGPWSSWSSCSRTCGRGVAVQSRRCVNVLGCRGSSVKYQICNPEECPRDSIDFRSLQCAEYNTIHYGGKVQEWVSSEDTAIGEDLCSLNCRPKGSNAPPVLLNPRVIDGTECGKRSSGICVHGHCQEVGCDLIIGSKKKKDRCGVCGGDGSSCGDSGGAKWTTRTSGPCSASCGGGYRKVEVICQNVTTREEVSDEECVRSQRPSVNVLPCAHNPCLPRWSIGSWRECSNSCGKGEETREVACIVRRNGTRTRVSEHECPEPRPSERRTCSEYSCPSWYAGLWSQCSSSCGKGFQRRVIQCRDRNGKSSNKCDIRSRPKSTRPCLSKLSCSHPSLQHSTPLSLPGWLKKESEDAPFISSAEPLNDEEFVPAEPTFIKSGWSRCSATCGEGIRRRVVTCKIFLEFSETIADLPDAHCPGARPLHAQPCNLGPCEPLMLSESSDDKNMYISNRLTSLESDEPQLAIRRKEDPPFFDGKSVAMKFKSLDKPTSSDFKYSEYPGEDVKDQNPRIISLDFWKERSSPKEKGQYEILPTLDQKYVWKPSGYTPCSASCLGGIQESISYCVGEKDGERVPLHLCSLLTRPKVYTRTCNEHPCPPHWETSDFGSCSKTCGGGITRRQVECVHKFTTSTIGKVILPDSECPQPPPYAQKFCNMMPCEKDKKKGSNECKEDDQKHSERCQGPHCRRKERRRKGPVIKALPQQNYKQKRFMKTVVLKIGGKAEVFHGSDVKIKCPVRRFDRRSIKWWRNGRPLGPQGKMENRRKRINKKGVLKISRIQYADAAVYSCSAGEQKASIVLKVEPLPASFVSSSEDSDINQNPHRRSKVNGTLSVIHSNQIDYHHLHSPSIVESKSSKVSDRIYSEERKNILEKERSDVLMVHKSSSRNINSSEEAITEQQKSKKPLIYGKVAHHGIPARRLPPTRGISLLSDKIAQSRRLNLTIPDGTSDPMTEESLHSVLSSPGSPRPREEGPVYGILLNSTKKDTGRVSKEGNAYFGTVIEKVDPSHSTLKEEKRKSPLQSIYFSTKKLRDHKERSTEDIMERMKGPLDAIFSEKPGQMEPLSSADHTLGTPLFLGKGSRDSLKFEWKVTNWTECSQTCSFSGSSGGYQVRSTQCVVRVNNVSQGVDGALCEDAGLGAPPTIQRCGFEECPQWRVDGWSECETSACFTLHYAYYTREVECLLHNGTRVSPSQCDTVMKPTNKRKCYNRECVGVWLTGEWSKCTAPCGGQGYRTRLLQCVWNGTKKSAGNACREQPRPEVVKWCDGDPCLNHASNEDVETEVEPQCRDLSRYCKIVQRINMCRIKHYRRKCCRSCRND